MIYCLPAWEETICFRRTGGEKAEGTGSVTCDHPELSAGPMAEKLFHLSVTVTQTICETVNSEAT